IFAQRPLQHEQDKRTAQIAVFFQNFGAPAQIVRAQLQPLLYRVEDISSAALSNTVFTCPLATSGTCGARIFRSMPPRVSNRSNSRSAGASSDRQPVHLTERRLLGRFPITAAAAPSPNKQALISTPGSSSR